ncbi:MAG: nicotinate phosphoribosyltransferase [Deltaproteobacteria bacterium]|nr:nicotinate phosphoribosyltransferase [Deltaproteobacteria bacterium]
MPRLWTASNQEILSGKVTDVYFTRTLRVLENEGVRKRVVAEFVAKGFPDGWPWAVLAGMDEALELLKRLPVTVRGLPEGTIFRPWDVVLEIEGDYREFGVYETAILGFLCQASGIATQAARCRLAAGDRLLVSFGARRMHPAIAPMIERSAYLGGCDGVATVAAAEKLGIEPTGTMPHALILILGDCVEATRAYERAMGPEVRLVSLIDTFNDEKFEAVRVAEALGDRLFAVRLDTPSSRRGSFKRIVEEVRWELDVRGFERVGIFLSGGLTENDLRELRPLVQGFGVGTSISAARTVDFSMDIVEVEGEPRAKRGKRSGAKDVYGCPACLATRVAPRGRRPADACPCGGAWEPWTVEWIREGRLVREPEPTDRVRERVLAQLRLLDALEAPAGPGDEKGY